MSNFMTPLYDATRGVFLYWSGSKYVDIPVGGGSGVTAGVRNYAAGTAYKQWDIFTDSGNKYLWRATQDFTASSFNLDSMSGMFELIGTSIFVYSHGVIYKPNYLFLDPTESYICKVDVPFVGTDFDSDLASGYFHALGGGTTDASSFAHKCWYFPQQRSGDFTFMFKDPATLVTDATAKKWRFTNGYDIICYEMTFNPDGSVTLANQVIAGAPTYVIRNSDGTWGADFGGEGYPTKGSVVWTQATKTLVWNGHGSVNEGGGGGGFTLEEFYTQVNYFDSFTGITSEVCDIANLLDKNAALRVTVNDAIAEINAAVATIDGKMNQFTITAGNMEEPPYGQYPALYITTQLSQSVLDAANSGNVLALQFNSVRHYDDGHFQGEFAHIGNEFVFQEGMGWNYTDGFSLAYDDTTGAMTRWSPCSADTHFIAEQGEVNGYIKITPRDPADILSAGYASGLVYVPISTSQTFDGIDLYNKIVAEKLETDIKLSELEARILALENA